MWIQLTSLQALLENIKLISSVASIFFVENATSGKIIAHEPPDKTSVTNYCFNDNDVKFGATIGAMVASVRNNALSVITSSLGTRGV